jgi:hypothetical protein
VRAVSNLNFSFLSNSAIYEAAAVCLKPDAGVGFVRCGSGPCYPHVKLSDVSH